MRATKVSRILRGSDLRILGHLRLDPESLIVVVALPEVLSQILEQQQTRLHRSFSPRRQPDLSIHFRLVKTKTRALLHRRQYPADQAEVVVESHLDVCDLPIGFVDPD